MLDKLTNNEKKIDRYVEKHRDRLYNNEASFERAKQSASTKVKQKSLKKLKKVIDKQLGRW